MAFNWSFDTDGLSVHYTPRTTEAERLGAFILHNHSGTGQHNATYAADIARLSKSIPGASGRFAEVVRSGAPDIVQDTTSCAFQLSR